MRKNRKTRRRRRRKQTRKCLHAHNEHSENTKCEISEIVQTHYCSSCNRLINKNNFYSKKMNALCSSCFKINLKENERRKINKRISKNKKKGRKFKMLSRTY